MLSCLPGGIDLARLRRLQPSEPNPIIEFRLTKFTTPRIIDVSMLLLTVAILSLIPGQPLQSPDFAHLHPAFKIDGATAVAIFDKGYKAAEHDRDYNHVIERFRRGIGGVTINELGTKETVSFLWVFTMDPSVYNSGFTARKSYLPRDQVEKLKESVRQAATSVNHVEVAGHIMLLPSQGGFYGEISRYANPQDLENVRVVMKVGDQVYEPDHQPGYALSQSGSGTNEFTTPEQQQTQTNVNITTPNGTATATATSTTTYNITHAENYDWYAGDFKVHFDLFNKDNTPRIRASDKEITFIVIYGRNERKAKYRLEDLMFLRR